MNFIKRADAATLIRNHWLATFTPEQLLAKHEPRWERLRNYELKDLLVEALGGEWCIAEWCPFNGRFCELGEHVPPPHPPMSDEQPHPPQTDVPWNEYTGPLYEAART